MDLDLDALNSTLRNASAEEIIRWAVSLNEPIMASTSFSPNAAVMLKLVTDVAPEMPVVWADSGYNVPDAYRVAEQLIKLLKPNLKQSIAMPLWAGYHTQMTTLSCTGSLPGKLN